MLIMSFPLLTLLGLAPLQPLRGAVPVPGTSPHSRRAEPGQPAPPLQVAEWVKGQPVPTFEKGKVYLVEFWATWCGPCIGSIPHLSALQRRHGKNGLVVIGLTSPDRQLGKDAFHEMNTLANVRAFVAKKGDWMDYRVAFDKADRETFRSYFGSDEAGIPHGFIIDRDGRVVLGGHPVSLGYVVDQLMAGTWDPVKGPERLQRRRALMFGKENETKEAFLARRVSLEKEFPDLAQDTLGEELLRAVLDGDPETVNRAGEGMIRHPLGGDMAYTINMLVNREPYAPKAKSFLPLAGRMSEAYLRATLARDPTALGLRADWLLATGQPEKALDFARRAVEAEIEPRREHLRARVREIEKRLLPRK